MKNAVWAAPRRLRRASHFDSNSVWSNSSNCFTLPPFALTDFIWKRRDSSGRDNQRDGDAGVGVVSRKGAAGGALQLGDEILRFTTDGEMKVVNAFTDVARGKGGFWHRVVDENQFHLAGEWVVRAAAAGVGIPGAVKVEEDGALELLTEADAGSRQFLFTFGRELVGDDSAANGGEDVAGVPVTVFVEAWHKTVK